MWYLYTGSRVQSVATGMGNTVAVPPYGKVEIHQLVPSTESMVKRGVLRPCGKPVDVKPGVHSRQVEGGGTALTPTKFAGYFSERGVTRHPDLPPVSVGVVEPTALEQAVAAGEKVIAPLSGDTVNQEQPAEVGDAAESPEEGQRRKR
jgi:hypothetical protein